MRTAVPAQPAVAVVGQASGTLTRPCLILSGFFPPLKPPHSTGWFKTNLGAGIHVGGLQHARGDGEDHVVDRVRGHDGPVREDGQVPGTVAGQGREGAGAVRADVADTGG